MKIPFETNLVDRINAWKLMFTSLGLVRMMKFILANKTKKRQIFTARFGNFEILIRSSTDDLYVVNEVLIGSEYRSITANILSACKSDIIIDAGAHIGSGTLKLRSLFPKHMIIAIEPEQRNFQLLLENSKALTRFVALNRALVSSSCVNQEIAIFNRSDSAGFTTVSHPLDNPSAKSIQKVEGISLEQILQNFDTKEIALLKVDIEGGEKCLFGKFDFDPKKIFAAYVETHDRIGQGSEKTVKDFFQNSHREVSCEGEKLLFIRK